MYRYTAGRRLSGYMCSILLAGVTTADGAQADEMHLDVQDFQGFAVIAADSNQTNVGTLNAHGVTLTASGNPYAEAGASASLSVNIPVRAGLSSATISVDGEIGLNSFAFYPKRLGTLGTMEVSGSVEHASTSVLLAGAFQEYQTEAPPLR